MQQEWPLGNGYLEYVKHRLYNEVSVWPQQVSEILFPEPLTEERTLVEAGCCVGIAYKTFKRPHLHYIGLDFMEEYVEAARDYFGDDAEFRVHDLHQPFIRGDFVVCSACLEHVTEPYRVLQNLMDATREHLVIRTFLGEKQHIYVGHVGLHVNQYSFDSLLGMLAPDFKTKVYRDRYTDSIPQYEHGVIRTFYIISARRR
jgi:SAM-dependent methyltransferase